MPKNSLNKPDKRSKLKKSGKEDKRKRRKSSSRNNGRGASTGSDADLPPPRPVSRSGRAEPSRQLGPEKPSGLLDTASNASDLSPPRAAARNEAHSGLLGSNGDDISPRRRSSTIPSFVDARGRSPPRRIAERSRSRDDKGNGSMQRSFDDTSRGKGDGKGKGKDGKGKGKDGKGKGGDPEEPVEKEEPNFEASGLLAVEDNAKNGVPLKFVLPPEARTPTIKWRFYCFTKGTDVPKILHVSKMPGYLFGKDRRVVDIPTDHQTCSKQHAVLHFRAGPDGGVRPYIMDLESINGTFLNGKKIEAARYNELREKDVLKFGLSSREFVLLHGGSTKHQHIDPKMLRSPSPE